jgi:hypothetical protein
MKKEPGEN